MRRKLAALVMLDLLATAQAAAAAPHHHARSSSDVMVTIYNGNLGLVKDVREVRLPAARRGAVQGRGRADRSHHGPSQVPHRPRRAQDPRAELRVRPVLQPEAHGEVRGQEGAALRERRHVSTRPRCSPPTAPSSTSTGRSTWGTTAASSYPRCPRTWSPSPRWSGSSATSADRPQRVEASYLTGGITWKADYVMVINAADTRTDLTGWVTIDNKSGATYGNAALKLVAGDVNRARDRAATAG